MSARIIFFAFIVQTVKFAFCRLYFGQPEAPSDSSNWQINNHFQIFDTCIKQLAEGKDYNEISKQFVPKTESDEIKLAKLGQKTKSQLHKDLRIRVDAALKDFPTDDYLNEVKSELVRKKPEQYNPKSELIEYCNMVDSYIDNLVIALEMEDNCSSDSCDSDGD